MMNAHLIDLNQYRPRRDRTDPLTTLLILACVVLMLVAMTGCKVKKAVRKVRTVQKVVQPLTQIPACIPGQECPPPRKRPRL